MNRRRSLLGLNSGEYVKDGLVLWLDGIKNTRQGHSSTPPAWENLSGNNIDGIFVNNVTYEQNGFVINKQSGVSYIDVDSQLVKLSNSINFSFEILLKVQAQAVNGVNYVLGFQSAQSTINEVWTTSPESTYDDGICIRIFSTRFPTNYSSYILSTSTPFSITVTYDSSTEMLHYYINAQQVFSGKRYFADNKYGFRLGDNNHGDKGTIKFFGCRYYDRTLTAEEIENNFNIDKKRFRIGG